MYSIGNRIIGMYSNRKWVFHVRKQEIEFYGMYSTGNRFIGMCSNRKENYFPCAQTGNKIIWHVHKQDIELFDRTGIKSVLFKFTDIISDKPKYMLHSIYFRFQVQVLSISDFQVLSVAMMSPHWS